MYACHNILVSQKFLFFQTLSFILLVNLILFTINSATGNIRLIQLRFMIMISIEVLHSNVYVAEMIFSVSSVKHLSK